MILLRSDCLVFEMSNGDKIPCSASTVTVELMGSAVDQLDREVVEHATLAVLHYFHYDLQRTEVTLSEFTEALETALRGLGINVTCDNAPKAGTIKESDLRRLAFESGKVFELGDRKSTRLNSSHLVISYAGFCLKKKEPYDGP